VSDSVLAQAFVYLAAAVVGVPIAKRLGLGSVLGYLLAGVAIGPFALGFVGHEGHHVMQFAEFGVVMMLFLVGLELKPSLLWEMRRPILGLGGLQVLATIAVIGGIAVSLGLPWKTSLAIGMILAMSSTAIVLQSLSERGLLKTPGGQATFSVLLFQDISVIPILAVFPLLAEKGSAEAAAAASGPPAWQTALLVVAAVAGVVAAGRYVVNPLFRRLAQTRLREVFTAAALFLIVGIALLMETVGLSPALGTFLAGVVLAESEYRHELESDIEPFKGLLLGLFFITVGAQIDFGVVAARPGLIGALVAGVVLVKLLVLYGLGRVFGLDRPGRWLFAFGLAQVGEFAFVLFSFGQQSHVLSDALVAPLVAVVALSMVITPLMFILLERVILPRVTDGKEERAADEIVHADNPVVIAGFGRFGQVVGRLLRANRIGATVLDLDPSIAEILGRLGFKVHYGDASRPELLHAAGCERAKLFVLAVDDPEVSATIAHTVRQHYPNLPILGRARNRAHYYQLRRAGVKKIFRETLASALEMAESTLHELGVRAHTAHRLAQAWRKHDERALEELGKLWGGDQGVYFAQARRMVDEAERLIGLETPTVFQEVEAEWDNESLREEVMARAAGVPTGTEDLEIRPPPQV
jgi:glutathione-regulated potassium-efflux system ancillary protein KefC